MLNGFFYPPNNHHDIDIAMKVQLGKSNGLNVSIIVFSPSHVSDHFDPSTVVILPRSVLRYLGYDI